ncbi:MAG: hypothetical protein KDA89_04705 [Planctomycetaceae bacterium]|nr:hypothetical protein [Planctomycetaceae bacterium]
MSSFDEFDQFQQFRAAWDAIRIERSVEYMLFTLGDSELPYYLVTGGRDSAGDHARDKSDAMVSVRQGQVRITRPRIITPDNMQPEFRNFFEDEEEYGFLRFLLARSATFSNLKLQNESGPERIVTDTMEEAVSRLQTQLDQEEEDRVAILTAPRELGGLAIFRYVTERVMASAPGNIQELRERGFLP